MVLRLLKLFLSLLIQTDTVLSNFFMGFLWIKLKSTLLDNSQTHYSCQDQLLSNFGDVSNSGNVPGFMYLSFR